MVVVSWTVHVHHMISYKPSIEGLPNNVVYVHLVYVHLRLCRIERFVGIDLSR